MIPDFYRGFLVTFTFDNVEVCLQSIAMQLIIIVREEYAQVVCGFPM